LDVFCFVIGVGLVHCFGKKVLFVLASDDDARF